MSLLYEPPEGFYDTPFIFVFNSTNLTNGQSYKNLFVAMDPAVGDFICRRVVGLQSMINPDGGQFQMQDNQLRYLQSNPMNVDNTDEIAILDDLFYKSTGAIRFDINDVQIAT